jgi:hypothetical protein
LLVVVESIDSITAIVTVIAVGRDLSSVIAAVRPLSWHRCLRGSAASFGRIVAESCIIIVGSWKTVATAEFTIATMLR